VEIKSHGRAPTAHHQDGRFISLKVKLPKGELIRGANRFRLIVRVRLSVLNIQTLLLAKKLGLIAQEEEWFRVKINSWPERIFSLEHALDNDFMESTGRASLWRLHGAYKVILSGPVGFFDTGQFDSDKSYTHIYQCNEVGCPWVSPDALTANLRNALIDKGG